MAAKLEVLTASDTGHDVLVHITGTVGFSTVRELLKKIDFTANAGQTIEIDLAGVDHIDSAGIALFLEWLERARRSNAQLRFVNSPKAMEQLVAVNGVKNLIL